MGVSPSANPGPLVLSARVVEAVLNARRPGRPLCAYVYDLEALAAHVREMTRRLPTNCRLFYAVKANSHPALLETLAPLVAGFDISSGGELDKVRAVAPTARLVFSGPGKTDEEIERGLLAGVDLFAVESVHELSRLDHLANRLDARARVLLRVNLRRVMMTGSYQMAGAATQFGIDETQLAVAAEHALRCRNLVVRGLHLHSVSNNVDATRHAQFIAECLDFARCVAQRYKLPVSVVDAGGGFGIDYSTAGAHFDWKMLEEGIHALASPDIELIIESGRFVAARCGYYAAEVVDLKRNHGIAFAVLRGGRHHFRLPEAMQSTHPVAVIGVPDWDYPFPRPEFRDVELTIVGQLCTPSDVVARRVRVGRIRVSDIVVLPLAGAYRWGLSYQDFLSHPHPDMIVLPQVCASEDS